MEVVLPVSLQQKGKVVFKNLQLNEKKKVARNQIVHNHEVGFCKECCYFAKVCYIIWKLLHAVT